MPATSDPIIICAENVAISFLLRKIPAPPSCNGTDCLPAYTRHHTLSFDTECKLADTLAFLAHSKDDVDHIPALCLEEDPDSGILNVIFAVNKANYNDGENAIFRIKQGFESVFAILASISSGSNYKMGMEKQVLATIVSMCSLRILCRLRLASSGRKILNRSFKDTLQEAAFAVKKVTRQKLKEKNILDTAEQFTRMAREVGKLIDSWSRYQAKTDNTRLMEIVEAIRQLQQIEKLPSLIHMIPNHDMDPTLRDSLLNIVGKISRYWEAARFLYRTAKKFPLARKMRTVPVHLPREAYDTPIFDQYTPDLLSKIIEASPRGTQQKLLKEICAVLDLTQQKAIEQYSHQVIKTLREGKVHAEIQLIAYRELENPKLYPRVICSSKDACFLCNMFLREYQKIHIPRSHGRLYPGWRLPCLPQLAEIEQRFCQTMGDHFKESCASLLSTRQKNVYPYPNESTLLTLPLSSTTTRASILSEAAKTAGFGKDNDSSVFILPESDQISINVGDSGPSTEKAAGSENGDTPSDNPTLSHRHTELTEEELKDCTLVLRSKEHGCLTPVESSGFYRVGPLHSLQIQIEHASGSKDLEYHLEWLGIEESAEVQEKASLTPVIDAEELDGTVSLHKQDSFYVTAKDIVLKISWASGHNSPFSCSS
ncbi:hypothetical protein BDW59DRAFT_166810 [Aspergillus cavernicola]|uniref:C2H2-type domain-containing protein n=1 Tax=Aspergillus cavernicola TaxID=176166 RepID=A0ABR4HIV7_9EURO